MKTPSQELTELVVPLLIKDGLLLASDAETHKIKFANGSMKSEDWLLAVEKALSKEGGK